MRVSKKNIKTQRKLINSKLKLWSRVKTERVPPVGWIKALRGAFGMTTYQFAKKLGVNQATAQRYEKREVEGKITLELLKKAADAMECRLIYAFVPKDEFSEIEEIIDSKAKELALKILTNVEHTMKLEKQGSEFNKNDLEELIKDLKDSFDSRIWDV